MSADAALRSILADNAAIAAIVGAGVYVATAPQDTEPPYVICTRPDLPRIERHFQGRNGLEREEWQIDCWTIDRVKADALGAAVRAALETAAAQIVANRGRMTFGTTELRSLRPLGRSQVFEPELKLHADRQAVVIWSVEP